MEEKPTDVIAEQTDTKAKTGTRDRAEHLGYQCGHCCRLCPFPGLKCIVSEKSLTSDMWKY